MNKQIVHRIIFLILFLLMTSHLGYAQDICPIAKAVGSYEQFRRIPILDSGRIKPLDTYARSLLLQFSGRRTLNKVPAIEWFARVIFDSAKAKTDMIFLINHPQIVESLGIEIEEKRRYSFAQLEERFATLKRLAEAASLIDEKDQDIVEAEIIRVYKNVRLYSTLTMSFTFIFPNEDFTVTDLETKNMLGLSSQQTVFSYLDIALQAENLQRLAMPLEKLEKGRWTVGQQEIAKLASNLLEWSMIYSDLPMQIVPSYMQADENWYSPWDAIMFGLRHKEGRQEIILLNKMMADYWNGRDLEFDMAIKGFIDSIKSRRGNNYKSALSQNRLEIWYNSLNPFFYAKVFYFFTFIIFSFGLIFSNIWLKRLAWLMLLIGIGLHFMGMGMRIAILRRPPVSNLYETFLFVGIISSISGIVIEKITKNWLGIAVASLSGYVFLSIAAKFGMEGDTLQMLVAVLNTNFWLATHVTTITVGYAGTCVAGIVGHVYLIQAIFKPNDKKLLRSTYNVMMGTLGFGLTFAFLGTNLGGIWADQSWGRFWGWDPKENGALMIILWTAVIFHAKIGKIIGPLGVAVSSILGIIVVAWAWFGVNLLSVGLHSYGFTSGLATNLLIYLICQLLFIFIAYPLARSKKGS